MTLYQLLLFAHVLGVVIWLGGTLVLYLLWRRAVKTGDRGVVTTHADTLRWFERTLAMPAAIVVLAAGGWLMTAGDWPMEQIWLHVGMAAVFGAAGVSMVWTARHRRKLTAGGEIKGLASRIDLGMIASMLILLVAFWAMIVKPGT
ncbi:MAG: DUF2269 family protein [Acidimicrobiia bacterium]